MHGVPVLPPRGHGLLQATTIVRLATGFLLAAGIIWPRPAFHHKLMKATQASDHFNQAMTGLWPGYKLRMLLAARLKAA